MYGQWVVRLRATFGVMIGCVAWFAAAPLQAADDPYASAPPYLRPLSPRVSVRPLLTVGQQLPRTGGRAGQTYRFVGKPDGLGLYPIFGREIEGEREVRPKKGETRFFLWVNHELEPHEGSPAGPVQRGARVSEILLDWNRARYLPRPFSIPRLFAASGRDAIERVYVGDEPQRVDPVTRSFAKFCSGFLAGEPVGFDRPIFLIGEEATSPDTFDPRGGQAWAVFEGAAWALPRFGRAEWENIVVAPFTDSLTVAFGLEDASGEGRDSQLYMYVGDKQPDATDTLARNGLRGGRVHVLCADDTTRGSEAAFHARGESLAVHWVRLDWDVADTEFDAASRAAGGFRFVRIEDGALDPQEPGILYFVTTGTRGTANPYGRLYRLRFEPGSPLDGATLEILLDGSEGIVHPDNVGVNRNGQVAIQEDPGDALRELGLQRDSSIWIYETRDGSLARIATVDRKAAEQHARRADSNNRIDTAEHRPGSWESSGIIDASDLLGRGTWICTVQAPSLLIAPVEEIVEGGQVLLITYR